MVLLGLSLRSQKARHSVRGLLSSFCRPTMVLMLGTLFLWVTSVVYGLAIAGLWTTALLKDTVVWTVVAAPVLLYEAVTSRHRTPLTWRVLKDVLGIIVLFEFIANSYTFSLVQELLFVPVVAVLVLSHAASEGRPGFEATHKVLEVMLAAVGFAVAAAVVAGLASDIQAVASPEGLASLLLPVVLAVAAIPHLMAAGAYSTYEQLFLRLDIGRQKPADVARYAKRALLWHFKLDLARAHRFLGRHPARLMQVDSRRDVQNLLLTEVVEYASDRRAHRGSWVVAEEGGEGDQPAS